MKSGRGKIRGMIADSEAVFRLGLKNLFGI